MGDKAAGAGFDCCPFPEDAVAEVDEDEGLLLLGCDETEVVVVEGGVGSVAVPVMLE